MTPPPLNEELAAPRRRPWYHPLEAMRILYDWMLSLAEKPYAGLALGGIAFAEASFFPLPPDPLLVAMGAGEPRRAPRFALACTAASVIGAVLGYAIGVYLMGSLGEWLLDLYDPQREVFRRIQEWYQEDGAFALFLAALTPIPFKVFTIASGAMDLPMGSFLVAAAVGRGLRFGLEGLLLWRFGAPIAAWIDRNFDRVAILFAVLLIGGFVAIEYL